MIIENFFLFKREWVFLYQNISGKYRVSRLTNTSNKFDNLKSDTSLQSKYESGLYIYFENRTKIELILSPAWTTDWITTKGRAELEKYGIAAPLSESADKEALLGNKKLVKCPQCGSLNTKLVSQFGSTACKALFQCEDCLEPFDYFKCLK